MIRDSVLPDLCKACGLVISMQDLKVVDKVRKSEKFVEFTRFISAFFLLMLFCSHGSYLAIKTSVFPLSISCHGKLFI